MSIAVPALVCRRLRLRQFRNFPELDLEFPATGVAVTGDNGAGKTNLLESIFYLEIFRSFRGVTDDRLVSFGAEAFHIRGWFEESGTGRSIEVTAAYETRTRTKRVTVDGVVPERLGDAVGRIKAVVFSPSDLALVAGAPAERRRFLDIVLSVNVPGYLASLQSYRHVLRQRNAMLRAGSPADLIEAFDEGFIDAGSGVLHERALWLAAHADGFARRYAAVGDGTRARLEYRPGLRCEPGALLGRERVREVLAAELRRSADRERERGQTLVGPHRDDISIVMERPDGDVDLREFGSGGQLRTAAVALRMIEAESARGVRGCAPLVLLDDVFAELDPGRSQRLLEMLETEGHGQVILTAPKASDVQLRRLVGADSIAALPRWSIQAGRITVAP